MYNRYDIDLSALPVRRSQRFGTRSDMPLQICPGVTPSTWQQIYRGSKTSSKTSISLAPCIRGRANLTQTCRYLSQQHELYDLSGFSSSSYAHAIIMSAILSSRMTEISRTLHSKLRKARCWTTTFGQSLRKHDRSMESVQREPHYQAALAFISASVGSDRAL